MHTTRTHPKIESAWSRKMKKTFFSPFTSFFPGVMSSLLFIKLLGSSNKAYANPDKAPVSIL